VLKIEATDYQTAPEFQVEAAAMQHLPSGLALGLSGYAYQQLGNDSGSGAEAIQAITQRQDPAGAGVRHRAARDLKHQDR
jgi:hypothetical protein